MTRADIVACAQKSVGNAFADWISWVISWEAAYVRSGDENGPIRCENVPGDGGGLTFCGCDASSHPHFPFSDPKPSDVVNCYLSDWHAVNADALATPLGAVLANFSVNCGASRAIKLLQQALQRLPENNALSADGQFGPVTLKATLKADPMDLAAAVIVEGDAFYRAIGTGRNARFLKGWQNRNESLKRWAIVEPVATNAERTA